MKKLLVATIAALCCSAAFAVNFVYTGGGTDPNDWFDAGNWSGTGVTNWPTAADNALFTQNGKDMVISQATPSYGQLQAGRGVVNTVTIVPGGIVTNANQTITGILNNGKGTLVVDGGTLVTVQIQINPAGGNTGGVPFTPNSESSMQVKDGSVQVSGNVLLGVNVPGTLEVSGGSLGIDGLLRIISGTFAVKGSDGTISLDSELQFGITASSSAELKFVLGADGAVSKISADSISFFGENTITIDGTFAETDAEQTLVLVELTGSDTFSGAELTALNESLELINVSSGSLSLSGDSKQLIFTGKPVARYLVKGWEFNTPGQSEGWDSTTGNVALSNVYVAAAVSGGETVLTCTDVTAGDGQLYYNQDFVTSPVFDLAGDSWRTLEVRIRQLDGNPGDVGVASQLFNSGGTLVLFQNPFLNFIQMENENVNWNVKLGSDNWLVATCDITEFGVNDLEAIRIDPLGNPASTNWNFEIDYVRLYAGRAQPPVVEKLAVAWEFNGADDPEGWGAVNATGLTTTNQLGGTGGVLTSADVTSGDPQCTYADTVSVGDGEWTTMEFRARQLTGNPGDVGTTSQVWNTAGTVVVLTGIANVTGYTVVTQANDWATATIDITDASDDITSIRLDIVGNDEAKNFEIDYVRLYKTERQTPYEFWAAQNGLTSANDGLTDDPDSDTFNNLYEYAFGGNPVDGGSTGMLPVGTSAVSGGSNVLEYVYFKNSSPYSTLTYSLVGDNDLVNSPDWTDPVGAVEVGTGVYTAELTAVTNHIPTDGAVKFIQTKATVQ